MGLGVDEGHKRVIGDHGSDPSRPQEDCDCSAGKMGEAESAQISEVKRTLASHNFL